MLICMRTTINLPDGLAEAAKAKAKAEGRTFTSLVEDGLRTVLSSGEPQAPEPIPALPIYGTGKGHLRVDLLDRDAVWGELDADGWCYRRRALAGLDAIAQTGTEEERLATGVEIIESLRAERERIGRPF